jgi:WD40 repeat protein
MSLGEIDCIAWNKSKENVLAVTCNNDIRIYDIRVKKNIVFINGYFLIFLIFI